MNEENKLTYDDIEFIVTALDHLENFWIDKRNSSNNAEKKKIYNDIIKGIRTTEKKVRQRSCF